MPLLVLVSLLAAPPASDESFEQGLGSWNPFGVDAMHALTRSSAAAHRGSFGLRFVDGVVNEGRYGPVVSWPVPTALASGPLYLRVWGRFSGVANQSVGVQFANAHRLQPGAAVMALSYLASPPRISNEGNGLDDAGTVANSGFGPELADDGGWHLYEYRTSGVGAQGLEYATARDGVVLVDAPAPLSSRGVFEYLEVGFVFSYGDRFAGTLDVDDLRTSGAPLASRLRLEGKSAASEGECVAVRVSLVDSWDGGVVEAAIDHDLMVTVNDGPAAPNNLSCAGALALPQVPSQATSTVIIVRASDAGTMRVRVESIDLIGAELTVTVEADGGVMAPDSSVDAGVDDGGSVDAEDAGLTGERRYRVECGCSESASAPWLVGLCLLGLARSLKGRRTE